MKDQSLKIQSSQISGFKHTLFRKEKRREIYLDFSSNFQVKKKQFIFTQVMFQNGKLEKVWILYLYVHLRDIHNTHWWYVTYSSIRYTLAELSAECVAGRTNISHTFNQTRPYVPTHISRNRMYRKKAEQHTPFMNIPFHRFSFFFLWFSVWFLANSALEGDICSQHTYSTNMHSTIIIGNFNLLSMLWC